MADDKAIYAYMPRIIKYYLGEDADFIQCRDLYLRRGRRPSATPSIIWTKLVTKPVGESGGYGLIVGPHASQRQELDAIFVRVLLADPANYISQR